MILLSSRSLHSVFTSPFFALSNQRSRLFIFDDFLLGGNATRKNFFACVVNVDSNRNKQKQGFDCDVMALARAQKPLLAFDFVI